MERVFVFSLNYSEDLDAFLSLKTPMLKKTVTSIGSNCQFFSKLREERQFASYDVKGFDAL